MILILFLPFGLILSFLIVLESKGGFFYKQERIGKNGNPFYLLKFRSMRTDADKLGKLTVGMRDPRITKIGYFIRKFKLDEFPQFINVLKGEMSIVGPRPIVAAEVPRYGRYFSVYCSVRPGITGLWQVSGRNDVSYRRRVAMDTVYCRSADVSLYIWIVIATVPSVLMSRGSY
jgi:exopolysaccharide production protein ExoY